MTEPIDPNKKDRTPEELASLERAGQAYADIAHAIRMHDPSGYRKDTIPGYPKEMIPDDPP